MRTNIATAYSNALKSRQPLIVRDLLWIEAKNRSTGETETIGFWSAPYNATIPVVSGKTRATVSRDYYSGYGLVSISPIPLTSDLTIQQTRITLNHVSDEVEQAIRGYEPRNAWVEIHRALLSMETREILSPPEPHFVGRIDKSIINTPAVGSEGTIELTCSSDLRELTRTNPAMKSHEQQRLRDGDKFRQYNSTAGDWQIFWGEAKASKAETVKPAFDLTTAGSDPRDLGNNR